MSDEIGVAGSGAPQEETAGNAAQPESVQEDAPDLKDPNLTAENLAAWRAKQTQKAQVLAEKERKLAAMEAELNERLTSAQQAFIKMAVDDEFRREMAKQMAAQGIINPQDAGKPGEKKGATAVNSEETFEDIDARTIEQIVAKQIESAMSSKFEPQLREIEKRAQEVEAYVWRSKLNQQAEELARKHNLPEKAVEIAKTAYFANQYSSLEDAFSGVAAMINDAAMQLARNNSAQQPGGRLFQRFTGTYPKAPAQQKLTPEEYKQRELEMFAQVLEEKLKDELPQ